MGTYYFKTINITTHYEHMQPQNTPRISNPEKTTALLSSQHQFRHPQKYYITTKKPKQTNKTRQIKFLKM